MGNTDLRDLASVESVAFGDLDGRLVAVDAHNWLYRYLTTTVRFTRDAVYTTADGEAVANLPGTVQGVAKLLEHDLVPAFVFDGEPTDLKADEVAERREARERAAERAEKAREAGDTAEAARLDSQSQRLTDVILTTTRELLELLDVPVVEAPAEGEAQAAHMAATDVVDYAGTEDYDALLFGSPLTLRQLTSSGDPELMDLADTLATHDLTPEQLVDVGILCGTDFNEGVHGVGPKTAVDAVHEHGDLFGVLEARGEEIPEAERIRQLFLDPPVRDDVTVASEVEPDVASARAYVTEIWEIPDDEVARGFERIEEAVTQTGLDRWT